MTYNSVLDVSGDRDSAIAELDELLDQAGKHIGDIRRALARANDDLIDRFRDGQPVTELVTLRAALWTGC